MSDTDTNQYKYMQCCHYHISTLYSDVARESCIMTSGSHKLCFAAVITETTRLKLTNCYA